MATLTVLLLLVLFVAAYVRYRRDIGRAYARIARGSRLVETPCGPIEYAVSGQGPPVLAIHGAGGGFDQGLDLSQELIAAGFRVIAPSRFGYLRTPLPGDASAEAQADAHACLLDVLGIARAAVIGASAGGPSALRFELRHPDRVSALVLLVPAAYAPPPEGAPPPRRPEWAIRLAEILLHSDFLFWAALHAAPQAMTRAILGTPPEVVARADVYERARVRAIMDRVLPVSPRRAGLLNDAKVVTTLPRYDLERIAAPTLALSVADDLYGTYPMARYCAEHIPGARFVGYQNGGHLLVGHGKEIAAAIGEFLRGRA